MLENSPTDDLPAMAQNLLPNLSQWSAALAPFISRVPDPSLAITNTFGGSLSMISPSTSDSTKSTNSRDVDGNSAALRLAQYTTQIVKNTGVFDSAPPDLKATVCKHLALILQLASDNLSVPGSMPLWESADPDTESEMVEFITEAQSLLGGWSHSKDSSTSGFISEAQKQLLDDSRGLTASSYYSCRAFSALTVETTEYHGPSLHINHADLIKDFRKSNDVFVAAAYLTSASESEELFRLCNYLLTDLTGHNFDTKLAEGMSNNRHSFGYFAHRIRYAKIVPSQLHFLESPRLR